MEARASSTPKQQLTRRSLGHGVRVLCEADPDLAGIVSSFGPPPLWGRRPGYATLVRIILEQQVSLASANAVYKRLRVALGEVTPLNVAAIAARDLCQWGFTRQKAEYCHEIATLIVTGQFDLRAVAQGDDATAHQALVSLRGVGPWTADIYLLMALRRPNIWPIGDLALAEATRRVKRLRHRPSDELLSTIASHWHPFRSVAARILWHLYLQQGSATK